MKILTKSFNGVAVNEPVADALGNPVVPPVSHFEVKVVAAGSAVAALPISSRRLAATAAHANGPAAGTPPSLPPANHANNRSLNPTTAPLAAGAADIAGGAAAGANCAAAGAATDVADDSEAFAAEPVGVVADPEGDDPPEVPDGADTAPLTGGVTVAGAAPGILLAPPLPGRSTTGADGVPSPPRATGAGSAVAPAAGNTLVPREPVGDSPESVDPVEPAGPAPVAPAPEVVAEPG
jgi:hypothetical protein